MPTTTSGIRASVTFAFTSVVLGSGMADVVAPGLVESPIDNPRRAEKLAGERR